MSVSETPIEDAYHSLRWKLAREGKAQHEKADYEAADAAIDAMTNTQLLRALVKSENS